MLKQRINAVTNPHAGGGPGIMLMIIMEAD